MTDDDEGENWSGYYLMIVKYVVELWDALNAYENILVLQGLWFMKQTTDWCNV